MASANASLTPTPSASRPPSREKSGTSTPTSSAPSVTTDKTPDESSKLKTFLGILKRFIGVADIAAVRFSLPPQLLEPIPNLEYWQYLDRPDAFASIPDSDEPLGRMLNTLRFWFTKDLKYIKGKPCKPYNSVLGEFFRCNWEVSNTMAPVVGAVPKNASQPASDKPLTISFLTEQTSHHPPVSAWYIYCPEKGISAQGIDQLSANFTGTRIRVTPGEFNLGIFITLHNFDDELYNLTHPVAHLGGLMRGALSVSVGDAAFITCPKTRLKAILQYVEDGWLGKAQNRMQGVIFKYDPANDNKTRAKDVPDADILGRVEGNWHEQIYFTKGSKAFDKVPDSEKQLVIDLSPLLPEAKLIPPEDSQLENESHKFWAPLTEAITSKQWGQASTVKYDIEERQRQKAAERKARNAEWRPRFFTEPLGPKGKPEMTKDGWETIKKLHEGEWQMEPSAELAA